MDPVDLVDATDVPTIPERFRHVIIDGGMYYAYMFRDNIEMAGMSQNKFENGIKQCVQFLRMSATLGAHRCLIVYRPTLSSFKVA